MNYNNQNVINPTSGADVIDSSFIIAKKKRSYKDVPFLVLLVLLSIIAMTILTALKQSAPVIYEADKTLVTSIDNISTGDGEFSYKAIGDSSEDSFMIADNNGNEFDVTDLYGDMVSSYTDANGAFRIKRTNGTEVVLGGVENYAVETIEISGDIEGLDSIPISAKDAVEKAMNGCSGGGSNGKNIMDPVSPNSFTAWPKGYTADVWRKIHEASGNLAHAGGECGKNASCSSRSLYQVVVPSSSVLGRLMSQGYVTVQMQCKYRSGGEKRMAISTSKDNSNASPNTSSTSSPSWAGYKGYYYFLFYNKTTASGGKCDGASCNSGINWAYIQVKHSYKTSVNCSINNSSSLKASGYQKSRSDLQVDLSDKVGIYYYRITSTSGFSTSDYPKSSGVPKTSHPVTGIYTDGKITVHAQNHTTYSHLNKTYDGAYLYIDSGDPSFSESIYLTTSKGGAKLTGYSNAGTLYMRVKFTDNSGDGCASGVYKIVLTNSSLNKTYYYLLNNDSSNSYILSSVNNITKNIGLESSTSATYWCAIPGNYVNGTWTCTIYDLAQNYVTSSSCSYNLWDNKKPTVNSVSYSAVSSDYTVSSTQVWTNKPIKVSAVISDTSGSEKKETYVENVKAVHIVFTYNGTKYELSSDSTQKETGVTFIKNYVQLTGASRTADTYKVTATFYLPYDIKTIGNFYIFAYDNLYSTSQRSKDGDPNVKQAATGKFRLDTFAPHVTSISVKDSSSKGATANNYSSQDIDVTVVAYDYSYNNSSVSTKNNGRYYTNTSTNKYSDGSGIRYFKFYYDASHTQAIPLKGYSTGVISNTPKQDSSEAISCKVTLQYDTARYPSGTIYVVAQDAVGNCSNGKSTYKGTSNSYKYTVDTTTDYTWSSHKGQYTNTCNGYYYVYMRSHKSAAYFRDTYTPQIVVCEGTSGVANGVYSDITSIPKNKIIASTNSLAYKGTATKTSLSYVYEYAKIKSTTFTVYVFYGSSGGSLQITQTGQTKDPSPSTIPKYSYADKKADITLNKELTGSEVYSSKSTTGATTYSAYKCWSKQITAKKEGVNTFTIKFANGAGVSASTVTITTRMDTTAPTINLVGFRTSAITEATIYNNFVSSANKIEANDLYKNEWNSANQGAGLYAIFSIADTTSGLVNSTTSSQKFGVSGASNTQYTYSYAKNYVAMDGGACNVAANNNTKSSGAYVGFSYTNKDGVVYKYNSYENLYPVKYGTTWFLQVRMFNIEEDMANLKNSSGTAFYRDLNGDGTKEWDVDEDTYLHYKVGISDFLGNIAYYSDVSTNKPEPGQFNDNVLRYNVDPFPINMTLKFYTIATGDWNASYADLKSGGYHMSYEEICKQKGIPIKSYNMSMNRFDYNSWTKDYIVIELEKVGGISELTTELKYFDLSGNFDDTGMATGLKQNYDDLPKLADTAIGASVYPRVEKNRLTTWYVISSQTKNVQIGIALQNKAYNFATKSDYSADANTKLGKRIRKGTIGITDGLFGYTSLVIKQDSLAPIIKYVYLSTDNQGENPLLWFDAKETSKNYTFTLNTELSKSKAYNDIVSQAIGTGAIHNFIWTTANLYVCIGATDKPSKLDGVGIKTVKFDGKLCTSKRSPSESEHVYITSMTYGYQNRNEAKQYSIVVNDHLDNISSQASYGNVDSQNNKMFSVIDSTSPYIYINSVTPKNYVVDVSEGITEDSMGKKIKKLTGEPTRERNIKITINYQMGISGIEFYLREREFGESCIDFNDSLSAGDDIFRYFGRDFSQNFPDNKKYLNQLDLNYNKDGLSPKWGNYETSGKWIDGEPAAIRDSLPSAAGGKTMITGSVTITIDVPSVHSRFDLIAVTGARQYYVIELGDVFIDTEKPIINSDLTVFSVDSENDIAIPDSDANLVVDYTDLQHIWTHEVGHEYTNGDVNVYYHISDTSSGVNDNEVVFGADAQVLEKVILKDIPVWKLIVKDKGLTYYFRRYSHESNPVIGTTGGMMTYNGRTTVYAYPGVNNYEVVRDFLTDTYYRLKFTYGGDYQITAKDIAGNGPTYSPAYNINIDKTSVHFSTRMTSHNGEVYSGDVFTNNNVNVTWTSTFGTSGFGGFSYKVEDKYNGGSFGTSTFKNYHVNVPQLSVNNNGYLVLTHFANVNDHKCDTCKICVEHLDLNNNKLCDYCNECITHTDKNGDNYCDICKDHIKHADKDSNGTCDTCSECITHIDADRDEICDRCNLCSDGHYNAETQRKVTTTALKYSLTAKTFSLTIKQSGNKYYWWVDGKDTKVEVNQDYYGVTSELLKMTWTVDIVNHKVDCNFTVNDSNAWYIYSLTAYNGVLQNYSQEILVDTNGVMILTKVRPNAIGQNIIKIDRVAPEIDESSGNYAELTSTEYWHAMARSLRVKMSDSLSGIGKTSFRKLDGSLLPNASISYKVKQNGHMFDRVIYMNLDEDGYFRAYDIEAVQQGEEYYQDLSLHFFDYCTEYTLKVYDEALNVTTRKFTPLVDMYQTKIETLTVYKKDGTRYEPYNALKENAVDWVNDVAKLKVNWSDTALYIDFTISYGESGYVLQCVEDYYPDDLGTDASAWTNVAYTRIKDPVSLTDGGFRETIRVYVADSSALQYLYTYRKYRAISKGQASEIGQKVIEIQHEANKHSHGESEVDANKDGRCDHCGVCMNHKETNINAYGKCLTCGEDIYEFIYKSYTINGAARGIEQPIYNNIRIELETYEAKALYGKDITGTNYTTVNLSEALSTGLIAIDKTTPTVATSLLKSEDKDKSPLLWNNYGTYTATANGGYYRIEDGDWWKSYVRLGMNLESDSNFASGVVYYYRYYSDEIWSDWVMFDPSTNSLYIKSGSTWVFQSNDLSSFNQASQDRRHEDDKTGTTKISSYSAAFAYIISTSQNNTVYEMKAETGAGLVTPTYRFGYISSSNKVYGIKVDTNTPVVNANGAKTFTTYASEPSQETLRSEYVSETSSSYIITVDATWTSYNTIIVNLAIENIGYSGVSVKYRDGDSSEYKTMFDISYNEYVAYTKANGGSAIYKYYHITKNGETIRNIRIDTNAGLSSEVKQVYKRIDNTTPIVYVTDIEGTKATNWGWTDNNLYNKTNPEFWYISELQMSMDIGVIENNQFSYITPYSGYTIEYTKDFKKNADGSYTYGDEESWIVLAEPELLLRGSGANIVYGDTYRFRITSGAGLVYYMGEEIFNNRGYVSYAKSHLNGEIKDEAGVDVITGHVSNGATGDYDDESYLYTFFVDSNAYSYSYSGQVYLGESASLMEKYDGRLSNFASYEVWVYDSNHVPYKLEVKELDRKFNRGDVIEIRYISKWNNRKDSNSEAEHNYFQDYTVSESEDGRIIVYCEGYEYEKKGTIAVQFEEGKIDITSNFIAEVEVTYGDDVFYLQGNPASTELKGEAYFYTTFAYGGKLAVELEYTYYKYNLNSLANNNKITLSDGSFNAFKIDSPYEIGAYYVVVNVKPGTGSFRITNNASVNTATDRKDFVIKYFEKYYENTHDVYYEIRNRVDFNNIDSDYFDILEGNVGMARTIETGANGLALRKTYLAASYKLTNNIDVLMEDAINGNFTGKFDGDSYTITVYDELESLRTDKETCDNHTDIGNGICDECNECLVHIDTDFNEICDFCNNCIYEHIDTDGDCDNCGHHVAHTDGDGYCNECGECVVHVDNNDNGRCDRCNECIFHNDKDNVCDECNICLHVDINNDGRCDVTTCRKCLTHKDRDNNGICDVCYGCTVHVDDDGNGVCDKGICGECITHNDANNNGKCDRESCGRCIGDHVDVQGDDICNECGICIEHKDTNADNKCDNCGECVTHIDSDGKCDRQSCGKCISVHTDRNSDHICDKESCRSCVHKDGNSDGKCDYCGICVASHTDTNKDGRCDKCASCVHTDIDNNKYCDRCGSCLHEDIHGDGICNACGYCAFDHKDADGICDDCGYCSDHVDNNLDGYCDKCGYCAEHIDVNADSKCDRCGDCSEGHTDVLGDYECNVCSQCTHKDTNTDDVCDICNECIVHKDANEDGVCDRTVCKECIEHTDKLSDNICNECGYCTVAHVDSNSDEICDICGYNLRNKYENGIIRDYGLFGSISGTVENLNVGYYNGVVVTAREDSEIGLLATEINGTVKNVTVITDVNIVALENGKFGGLAAKTGSDAEISLVYTDVRITNNGSVNTNNSTISSFIGNLGLGTTIDSAYIFGEVEVYNVTGTKIGSVYGDATVGTYQLTNSSYLGNNAFLNGNTVTNASSGTQITASGVSKISYEEFATLTAIEIANTNIYKNVLTRLYKDFGYEYTDDELFGNGTEDNPLEISNYNQLMAINGYMNLSFEFVGGTVIDMSDYEGTIAVTKVFNGNLTSSYEGYTKLTGISKNMTSFKAKYDGYNGLFGLFGQLNGRVEGIVFTDIAIDVDYNGTETLYAGLVAGRAYENAVISDVILIGEENITTVNNAKVYAGGVVGQAVESTIKDVFTINNVMVVGGTAIVGGLVGIADNVSLPDTDAEGAVLVLGRAVARSERMTVGAVIGSGTISGATANNVYAIKSNAYAGEIPFESRPVGSMTINSYGINMVTFTDTSINSVKFAGEENAVYDKVFGKGATQGYYPLVGRGTTENPFEVGTVEDFDLINLALYASYKVTKNLEFTNGSETIGQGLRFTGEITGSGGDNISAEESSIVTVNGLTAPLVYYNEGSITSISINVVVEHTVKSEETYYFGGVAIYNDGNIRNVTVSGTVDITSESNDTTLYVSGFVAVSYGGVIEAEISKIQNSISALDIDINGGGTVYAGGYAAVIREGEARFSYGIATGSITVTEAKNTYAGLLVGYSYGVCEWELGESASIEYTYTIIVDGVEIPKIDEITGEPLTENFVGIKFGE